jgi:hypothetical protein
MKQGFAQRQLIRKTKYNRASKERKRLDRIRFPRR